VLQPNRFVQPPAIRGFEHVRRFWQPDYGAFVAKILPGEYYVTRGGEWIVTVLGSCVSACVRDPVAGVGGMNHFMLPEVVNQAWKNTGVDLAHRYGSFAMEHLINDILKQGAQRNRLEVKIVGGGQILANMTDIGARNIEFVRKYLLREGFLVSGENLGGTNPRKVFYDVSTGRVRVKRLPAQTGMSIVQEELGYRRVIESRKVTGDVELF
jgi:chemotaxis protein CheD